jgi:oxygen-dependent protoporphyrinogen oxidase
MPRGPAGRGADESVASFARRRFGPAVADRVFGTILAGLYAGDPEQTSLPSAFPKLAAFERAHRSVILGAVRAPGGGRVPAAVGSLPDGLQELTDALARDLDGALRLGVALRRVERVEGRFRLAVEERGAAWSIDADAVVLALPAHAAAPAVAGVDADLAGALGAIPYAPVSVVHVGYRARDVAGSLDGFGFLVPPSEPAEILGVIYASSLWPGRAPDGTVLLSALVGGAIHPERARLADEALVGRVTAEVGRLLGARGTPVMTHVVRHERAIPQYTLGHRDRVARIAAAEARLPGMVVAGNALRGIALTDCLGQAPDWAARAAAARSP